jgi:hypothetical protein
MSRTLKRWTPEEERVLRDQVSRRPNNLSEAFRRTAALTDRTFRSVEQHWYYIIKHQTNVCFMTASDKSVSPNRKNVIGEDTAIKPKKKSWWRNLLSLFRLK